MPSFAAKFAHELSLVAALPLTASRAEIFEIDFGYSATRLSDPTTAAMISPDRTWREMVASALAKRGLHIASDVAEDQVDVIVFDADPWNTRRASELAILRQGVPRDTTLDCLLRDFLNTDLEGALREAGADHVWFKLESLEGLADQMIAAVSVERQ